MNPHLSDHDLLNRLYGVGEHDAHLESCPDCATRWEELRARRGLVLSNAAAAAEVSDRLLAAQQSKIYARLGSEPQSGTGPERPSLRPEAPNGPVKFPRRRMRWAPAAVAAAALVAVGLFVYRPVARQLVQQPAVQQPAEPADAQLFANVYSVEQSVEPVAAEPIHALFEEGR